MTIFRHKNGLLYTIEMVKRRMYTETPWIHAKPYLHDMELNRFDRNGNPKNTLDMSEFEKVAVK